MGFWCSREKSNRQNGKQIDLLDAQIPCWMMPRAETGDYWSLFTMVFIYYTSHTHTHAEFLNSIEKRKHQNKGILHYLIKHVKKYSRKNTTLHIHLPPILDVPIILNSNRLAIEQVRLLHWKQSSNNYFLLNCENTMKLSLILNAHRSKRNLTFLLIHSF